MLFFLPVPVDGFEPQILGLCWSTTVPLGHNQYYNNFTRIKSFLEQLHSGKRLKFVNSKESNSFISEPDVIKKFYSVIF